MQIVGSGFLARHVSDAFGDRFPEVTALAAGVSSTSITSAKEFDRDAELLYEVLQRCRRQRRMLLYFSTASFAMYGAPEAPAVESGPLCPPTAYGRHKLALESSIQSAGVDYLILRVSHLVGRYQRPHQLLPGLVSQIQSGTVTVYKGVSRDLLDIRDLMHATDRLLEAEVSNEVLNVVSGVPVPVERIVDGIEERLGTVAQRVHVTGPRAVLSTPVSLGRLEELIPEFKGERVGGDYLSRMLDDYLPHYVAGHGAGPRPARPVDA